jgi:hypothetical protein
MSGVKVGKHGAPVLDVLLEQAQGTPWQCQKEGTPEDDLALPGREPTPSHFDPMQVFVLYVLA